MNEMSVKPYTSAGRLLLAALCCATLIGCGDDGATPGGETPGGETPGGETPGGGTPDSGTPPVGSGAACPAVAFAAVTAGCTMTIRNPANCAVVSLGAELAWEADACHTPYYLQIAGNPPSEYNYNDITINTEPINALAWAEALKAEHLAGLVSTDGWYHWRICNAYETGCSASRAFLLQ